MAASTPHSRGNAPFYTPASKSIDSISPAVPNGYPGKSALSLEIEEDDRSTSSDDHKADPFNPDSSVSDNDDEADDYGPGSLRTGAPRDDRPPESSGTAPHPAPSADGSTVTPSTSQFIPAEQIMQSATETRASGATQDISSSVTESRPTSPPEGVHSISPSNRSSKERRPPPPPKSHHGKRIGGPASASSSTTPSITTNRLSHHASSPGTSASARTAGTPGASSTDPSTQDYFSVPSKHQSMTGSTDSLQRTHSQHKRPPTPPLSRRHSQMQRSKSTQSNSSRSRLAQSAYDSESDDSSQPPSPDPSNRSVAPLSQERKRISMPPPSSGDPRAVALSSGPPSDTFSPTNPRSLQPGRRASSHGSILSGSSPGAPPPPPPRRARDSSTRSSESGSALQTTNPEAASLPQPSNAQDILADLSRLQKEVDDLRGHYENRKVSQ